MATRTTQAQRIDALEAAIATLAEGQQAILAALSGQVPAKAVPAPKKAPSAKSEAFVTWLHETAEARAERKASNKVLAAALRKAGIEANGEPWARAKAALAAGKTVAQAVKAAK